MEKYFTGWLSNNNKINLIMKVCHHWVGNDTDDGLHLYVLSCFKLYVLTKIPKPKGKII